MTKCGIVTILGKPNSGKSTLTNRLVGYKVSIVTHKQQTTRTQIRGILTVDDNQVIFIDTPGIFKAKKGLEKAMVATAYQATQGVDLNIYILDCTDPDYEFLEELKQRIKGRYCIVLNKTDKISSEEAQQIKARLNEDNIFFVSALTGEGLQALKEYIFEIIPDGPFLYGSDQLTNISEKLWAAELTREQIMLLLHQEIPYEIYVDTELFEEKEDGSYKIHQAIVVSRETLKPMLIGHNGSMIKKIGSIARAEMTKHLERPVHLFLFVKVQTKWQEKSMILRNLGILR